MLQALAEAGIRPDLVVGTSIGALNGAFVAADPSGAAARLSRMWQGEELRLAFSEKLLEPDGPAGPFGHAPALPGAAGPDTGRRAARQRLRGPQAAVPVRGGGHRERERAVVQLAGRWCPRSWPRARCPGCCCWSRPRGALLRRRSCRFDPGRAGSDAGGRQRVRAAGGADREPARDTEAAVGGGTGGVRDRAQAPVPRGHVSAARGGAGARR